MITTLRKVLPSLVTGRLFRVCSIHNQSLAGEPFNEDLKPYTRRRLENINYPFHPYANLYPWGNSLTAFVDHLYNNIVYQDENILAIDKPFGVGIHLDEPTIHSKNSYILDMKTIGQPKYCLDDALPELESKLGLKKELKLGKSIDRFESGVVLFAKNEEGMKEIQKISKRNQTRRTPFRTYWVITKGYPLINEGKEMSEEVVIKQEEIDELGEWKEPLILDPKQVPKNKFKEQSLYRRAFVSIKVLDTNKKLSVSLLQINSTLIRWQFIRCFAASKSSFILGDVRFSKRVRQVLGQPVILSPGNIPGFDEYQPLAESVRRKLKVRGNEEIPLMMHHKAITLPFYAKTNEGIKQDFTIESHSLPLHFQWTLKQLDLKPPKEDIEDGF